MGELITYSSTMDINFSDHKPVYGIYKLYVCYSFENILFIFLKRHVKLTL